MDMLNIQKRNVENRSAGKDGRLSPPLRLLGEWKLHLLSRDGESRVKRTLQLVRNELLVLNASRLLRNPAE